MNQMMEKEVVIKEDTFPKHFLQLVLQSEIQNAIEGLTVLLHSCLLEVGFKPKDVKPAAYSCMPDNWKSDGYFKIQYFHSNVPDKLCWVTWVPLYSKLIVQGTVDNEESEKTVHYTLPSTKYINSEGDISDPQSLFCQTADLSRLFKDEFCYPLLALLEESANCTPSFGFCGLPIELKLLIIEQLPVESIVSLSSINKDFYKLTNSKYLWRALYLRDIYAVRPALAANLDRDWKGMYKAIYLRRKDDERMRPYPMYYQRHHCQQVYPSAPNFGVDNSLFQYMDPVIQQAFPQLHYRNRRFNCLFPGGGYPYMGRFW